VDAGELAALSRPDARGLADEPTKALMVAKACEGRASRVDVSEGTRVLHRVALARCVPLLGTKPVDGLTVEDVNALVSSLSEAGKRRETIKKSVKYLAAVLDECGVDPNPARDKLVRYPHEERVEIEPPTSEHVEAVYRLLPSAYRLPLLWLDWSGARVGSIESVKVGDYDAPARRVRLRAAVSKNRRALWVDLPDVLVDAIEAGLPPREDRDPDVPLFAGVGADRLRTAIARACKASCIPVFSPHDLRHRRISFYTTRGGRGLRSVASSVSERSRSRPTTYTHVLSDGREVAYKERLAASALPMAVDPT
jgi:integrase